MGNSNNKTNPKEFTTIVLDKLNELDGNLNKFYANNGDIKVNLKNSYLMLHSDILYRVPMFSNLKEIDLTEHNEHLVKVFLKFMYTNTFSNMLECLIVCHFQTLFKVSTFDGESYFRDNYDKYKFEGIKVFAKHMGLNCYALEHCASDIEDKNSSYVGSSFAGY
jgi:hypothetical protein